LSGMKPFTKLMSFEEALGAVLSNVNPVERTETLALDESDGRVVSRDITARVDVPRFDRAAMDGYAVIAEDTFGASPESPKRLRIVERLHAADVGGKTIAHGECAQVATGSPLPKGTDSVVMVEYTEETEGYVEIFRPIHPGGNVSRRGSDIRIGSTLLPRGDRVTPSKIGAMAAVGITELEVYVRPKVALVPTGDEIVKAGSIPKGGQVFDINSHTLAAIVRENGGEPVIWDPVPDDESALSGSLSKALSCDLVVFSGGSSVGERDLISGIFSSRGEVFFHGVQVKPGKPTLFALINGKPVFSMPGHPTSCLSNGYLFLAPCLRKMARLPEATRKTVRVKMARRLASTLGRKQFLTVRVQDGVAYLAFKESSAITSMSSADGYLVLPENVESIEKGQEVEVTLFS